MVVNHDEKIVVLDRQMYDYLRALAEVGANELGREAHLKPILKHARRFNAHLAAAAAALRKARRKKMLERSAYAKAVLRHCGKTLQVSYCNSAVRILGRSTIGPDHVRVRFITSDVACQQVYALLATTLVLPEST